MAPFAFRAIIMNICFLLLLLLHVTHAFMPIHSAPAFSFQRIRGTPPRTARTTRLQAQAHWQSHVSTHMDALGAVDRLIEDVTYKEKMGLAFLFVGQAHASEFEAVVQHAYSRLQSYNQSIQLLSMVGGGVIGENVELDEPERPSMSLLLGELPEGAEVEILEYSNAVDDDDNNNNDNDDKLKLDDRFDSCLVFCDPWAPVENILMEYLHQSGRVVAGGISCPYLADQSSLALNDRALSQGSMMGVGFAGALKLQTMVAQGCRPIGTNKPRKTIYTITACEGNLITELDHQPALEVLQQLANTAPPEEQEQISSGLLCGVAKGPSNSNNNNNNTEGGGGERDFLSRQILGFAPSLQGIAVGTSNIEAGDLFCFQVRDGTSAQQDLALMVQRAKAARLFDNANAATAAAKVGHPVAALQISCVARGRGMFGGVPNVDLSTVKRLVESPERGPVVGGFFANGEIGPVGLAGFSTTKENNGNSYLHSFTTVAAILCEYTSGAKSGKGEVRFEEEPLDAWG